MERDPYNTSINWMQQSYSAGSQQADPSHSASERQEEATGGQREYAYPAHTPPTPQTSASASSRVALAKQAKKKPNMPKQRALALVSSLKKGIIVSSVVSFGFLGVLSANHLVSTMSSNTVSSPSSSSSSPTTKSSGSSSTTSSSSSTTQSSGSSSTTNSSSGSSLNQQSGGYGFGSSSSSQGSASGTSVS